MATIYSINPKTGEKLPLPSREQEVSGYVGQGLRNKEIAAAMGIADKTVENHLQSIFRKTGLTRTQLAQKVREGEEPAASSGMHTLSDRERGILALIKDGMPNKQIAWQTNISEYTVKNHVKRMLDKLHARNRVELATMDLGESSWADQVRRELPVPATLDK